ncbi:hypothetical protein TNCT6_10960 [Streptomyces sp. 6-11-2]|nr:hypothetical protein TNCT6_10960 [Streptomyces sp. 6-11-2]
MARTLSTARPQHRAPGRTSGQCSGQNTAAPSTIRAATPAGPNRAITEMVRALSIAQPQHRPLPDANHRSVQQARHRRPLHHRPATPAGPNQVITAVARVLSVP